MKKLCLPALVLLISCGNSNENKKAAGDGVAGDVSVATSAAQQGGIVGEWEQQYTAFDKNGDNKLDPDEKKPSGTQLGFNWFKFNADGTCLRDKEVKFKDTYEVQEKGNSRKLVMHGVGKSGISIVELTEQELILGLDGAFIVFKRV